MSALNAELLTVDAVLASGGTTRRVDALALMWIKVEKQLRRLFSYLVFQHPSLREEDLDEYIAVLVGNRDLYAETFVRCFDALAPLPLAEIVGADFADFWTEWARIKRYRNKLLHGQITGLRLPSLQLERDVRLLRAWMTAVSERCAATVGYDGVSRNTFREAKQRERAVRAMYPWRDAAGFKVWLETQVRNRDTRNNR